MRIAFISPKYLPILGGVEHVVSNLAEGMVRLNHDVYVLCGDSSVNTVKSEEINGVIVYRIPDISPNNTFHMPKDNSFVKIFLDNEIDIVHTHSVHSIISVLPLIFKSTKCTWKLIFTMHFSSPGYSFLRRLLWTLWIRYVNSHIKHVDVIHATSTLELKKVTEYFSNAKGKVTIIPLGINKDVFNHHWQGMNSDYILYCGRLEKYKRLDLAINALPYLSRLGCGLKLVIVGSGSRSKYYKKLSTQNGEVIYLSPRPRREYLHLISNARAVINLSPAENFNIFLAEAYTMGTPIIATQQAAAFNPEIAVVNDLHPQAIAAEIAKITLDPTINISSRLRLTPWGSTINHFEQLYFNCLNEGEYISHNL